MVTRLAIGWPIQGEAVPILFDVSDGGTQARILEFFAEGSHAEFGGRADHKGEDALLFVFASLRIGEGLEIQTMFPAVGILIVASEGGFGGGRIEDARELGLDVVGGEEFGEHLAPGGFGCSPLLQGFNEFAVWARCLGGRLAGERRGPGGERHAEDCAGLGLPWRGWIRARCGRVGLSAEGLERRQIETESEEQGQDG